MRIIKSCPLQKIQHTCDKCGTIYEFDKDDVSYPMLTLSEQCEGGWWEGIVRCPYCEKELDVSYNTDTFELIKGYKDE